jgi:hypothetical protein
MAQRIVRGRSLIGAALIGLLVAAPVCAQESVTPAARPPAQPLTADAIAQIEQAFVLRDRLLNSLLQRIETLERELAALRGGAAPDTAPGPAGNAEASVPVPSAAAPPPTASAALVDEDEQLARAALDRALVSRGGLLLPRWTLEFEQNATYFNASSDRISIDGFTILPVLVVGDIVSERVQRDIVRVAFTTRIGLPGAFQADVRLPYGYEKARTISAENQEQSRSVTHVLRCDDAAFRNCKTPVNHWHRNRAADHRARLFGTRFATQIIIAYFDRS